MGRRPALCALLVLLAASIGVHGAAPERTLKATTATAGKVTVRKCNDLPRGSTAAYDQLMAQHEGSKCSDFIKGVIDWNLKSLLRSVSRGKIIMCPTNAALQSRFMKMGLYKRPFEVPASAKQAFRTYIRTMVALNRRIIDAKYGCGSLYYTHKIGLTSGRIGLIPQGSGARKADGDNLEYQYSVLGQGYNSYVGFPLSFGMSSVDPGFTLTPIFQLTPDNVRTLASTGGGCTSQFSSSSYNSAQDMKESVSASLQIGGNLSGIAFSASASFSMVSQTSMTSQTITISSGAKVYLGGYGLAAGPGGLTLDPGFVANCLPLMQAASEDRYDSFALQSLVDNYGTHYIKTVWYGGLASVITQMTAQSYSSLSSLGVSVSIAVQAPMVQVSADVDYSKTNTQSVSSVSSTFSQVLIPSSVPLALTTSKVLDDGSPPSPTFIDCVQWTTTLKGALDLGWKAPVHYTLAPMAGVFSYPQIFPSDWASVLPAMQRQVYMYQKTCGYTAADFYQWEARVADTPGYTACPTPTYFASCPTGTYLTKTKRCNTCYGDGSVIGPNCNSTYTLSCTAFACYCMPKYADDFDITSTFCTPLSANPPAPPAPSMAELSSRKKALK
ncbi:hypothetical protein ABPG77_000189 [Micractinium sp. CCAP 211/92]